MAERGSASLYFDTTDEPVLQESLVPQGNQVFLPFHRIIHLNFHTCRSKVQNPIELLSLAQEKFQQYNNDSLMMNQYRIAKIRKKTVMLLQQARYQSNYHVHSAHEIRKSQVKNSMAEWFCLP